MNAPSAPTEGGEGISPKFIINVLRRWWLPSVLLGVLLAAVAAAVPIIMYEPQFRAETWLWIRQTHLVFPHEGDSRRFLNTQKLLVTSPPVLTDVLTRPEIASLPIFKDVDDKSAWLKRHIRADGGIGGSEFFVISLTASDRDSVHVVVNAIRDAYLATLRHQESKRSDDLLELLKSERSRRSAEITSDRERLETLVKSSGGIGVVQEAVAADGNAAMTDHQLRVLSSASQLQQQLQGAEVELVLGEIELKAFRDSLKQDEITVSPEAITQYIESQPEVQKMIAEISLEEDAIARNAGAAPKSRVIADKRANIVDLKKQIAELRASLAPTAEKVLLKQSRLDMENDLKARERALAGKKQFVEVLRGQLDEARKEISDAGGASLAIQFLQEDLALKQEVYNRIISRIEQLETEKRAESRVTTLQDANKPIRPEGDGPLKKALMFGLGAFGVPFGCFFLWDLRRRQLADVDDLAQAAKMGVVGEVAALPVKSRLLPGGGRKFEQSLIRFEESVDYLRATIMQTHREQGIRSLVICSASSREGKTTLAAHLASSLSRSLDKVIIVDADMRRPHLHNLLEQEFEHGLADYLSGKCTQQEATVKTWIEGLDMIAAGEFDTSVSDLLATEKFGVLLHQLYDEYDFVVIDVPPVLPVSDGLVIARQADAAVFCALRDVSSSFNVKKACQKLSTAGVNLIGSIFNGTAASRYSSDYEYYYYGRRNR